MLNFKAKYSGYCLKLKFKENVINLRLKATIYVKFIAIFKAEI